MKPNRKQLETFLGKNVKITIYNNNIIKGELHKVDDYNYNNYYRLINPQSPLFRVSHVKAIEMDVVEND